MSLADISGIINGILIIAFIALFTDVRNLNKSLKNLQKEINDLKNKTV